ncbi:DNA-formamidopyrimidine glycosylase [Spiroplasma endosymbiont of Amphibalanus improvisus]|uniref:DNA-formamidopyrimidine glycosylase n=1 Tax=Spiroplasma endosymbiont of Amphibalanus improvisus TaxID=3066327 RepID=UPI00313EA9B5
MPELPEVETVKRYLEKNVVNQTIKEVRLFNNKIVKEPEVEKFLNILKGKKILKIDRLAKYLFFILDDYVLISHLRMEGKYFYAKNDDDNDIEWKHVMFSFVFNDGSELRYHDTRKFGTLNLQKISEYKNLKPYLNIGYEPFNSKLTPEFLQNSWKNKSISVKTALLDQKIISGIGNIYANEILFASKIRPETPSKKVTLKQIEDLIEHSKIILLEAIKKGGTTIKSYHSGDGQIGEYKNNLKVHGRIKQNCFVCNSVINKIQLNGRGTYFCPNCQK